MEMRIKEYRKQQKLTQVQMAERWQTDAGNLSRVERGVQRPSIELAERIAADTGLTLDEIFSESRDLHAA
ncbi:MAG: helix-turn-helix transcriptional regulator [Candidatus Thiodiazotropha sp. (ex Ctena orbiculata)]|nr:helix-turn-helix transcriptional regulator [Candidatus Thiodiazotropha taylori]